MKARVRMLMVTIGVGSTQETSSLRGLEEEGMVDSTWNVVITLCT